MTLMHHHSVLQERYERITTFRLRHIDPYPSSFSRSHSLAEIHNVYSYLRDESDDVHFKLCGRVVNICPEDEKLFVEIEDQAAKLQFVIHKDKAIYATVENFKKLVLPGDWIGFAVNCIFRSRDGKLTAKVYNWQILALCLLPFSQSELEKSPEYFQLALNRQRRHQVVQNSLIIRFIRHFLEHDYNYLEVPAPFDLSMYEPSQPTYHESYMSDYRDEQFISISSPSHLRQLIIAGFHAVYTINHKPKIDNSHLTNPQDLQILSCQMSPADYTDMMDLVEQLITKLAVEIYNTNQFELLSRTESTNKFHRSYTEDDNSRHHSTTIDLSIPWSRQSLYGLIQGKTGVDFLSLQSIDEAMKVVQSFGLLSETENMFTSVSHIALHIFENTIVSTLIQPIFVVDYSIEDYPLVKHHRHDARLVEYFSVFVNGTKFAYGYSQLNDPSQLNSTLISAVKNDAEYMQHLTEPLNYGLPPTGGLELDIGCLIALLNNLK